MAQRLLEDFDMSIRIIDNDGRLNDPVIIEIFFWVFLIAVFTIVAWYIGHDVGYNAGVRDAIAGKATVIEKPDLTSEVVQIKRAI